MEEPTSSTSVTTIIGLSVGRDLIVHNGDVTSVVVNPAPEPPPIVTQFQQFDSPTPHFTGRSEILNKLHSLMSQCQTKSEYIEKIVVLHGCGGIGKSELARTFAKACASDSAIHNVAWINADSLPALTSSFMRLARKLQIGTENRLIEEIVQEVYEHFSENIQKGLFIFDNARQMNDDEFPLINYMPAYQDTYPLFLITTRHNTCDEISSENKIHVQELSTDDAVALLRKRLRLSDEQQNSPEITNALNDLAKALQGFPLALALAGSNIPNAKIGWLDLKEDIRKYIEGMNVPQGGWPNHKQTGAATKYKLIMDNVWDLSLEQIKTLEDGDEALKLLNLLAYALPDSITLETIGKIYKRTFDRVHKEMGLRILEQYSLIDISDEYHGGDPFTFYIRIHRLIQLCTRDKLDKIQDYSYLLGHCKYVLRAGYDGNLVMTVPHDMMHIHRHLRIRNWPGDLIAFSVFFIKVEDEDTALEILEDLCNVFKKINNDNEVASKEITDLFYLSVFYNKYFDKGEEPYIYDFIKKSDTVFVEHVKLYIQQLLLPAESPMIISDRLRDMDVVNIARNCSFKLCQKLLSLNRLSTLTTWKSFEHFTPRIVDIVKETVASTNGGCRLDTILHLYQVLWQCNWNIFEKNPDVAFECARLVFAKHAEFLPSLVTQRDQHNYWDNWEKNGPLPVSHILKKLKGNIQWSQSFVELFAPYQDGSKILVHTLQFMHMCRAVSGASSRLFELLVRLCCDWGLAETLSKTIGFMDALLQNTKMVFTLKHSEFCEHQLWVLVSWFGMFSHNDTFRDANGQCWSILSVSDELEMFLKLRETNHRSLSCREVQLMVLFLDATSFTEITEGMRVPIKFAKAYLHKFYDPNRPPPSWW